MKNFKIEILTLRSLEYALVDFIFYCENSISSDLIEKENFFEQYQLIQLLFNVIFDFKIGQNKEIGSLEEIGNSIERARTSISIIKELLNHSIADSKRKALMEQLRNVIMDLAN